MVRVKHRYLLVQILSPASPPLTSTTKPTPLTTLAIHAPTPDTINPGVLLRLLRTQLSLLFGDHGAGAAGSSLQIKYFSNATSTFIVRCARAVVRAVWASLTFIGSLPVGEGKGGGSNKGGSGAGGGSGRKVQERERRCVMQVVRVSGTIRKCEEEAIRRARALMGRVKGLDAVVEAGGMIGGKGGMGSMGGDEVEEEEAAGMVVMAHDDDGEEDSNDGT